MTVSQSSAGPGEEVDLTINMSDNPGIVGITLAFEYDTSRLNLLSIKESGLSGIWQKGTGVTWASSTGDSTYNGVFLTLKFEVLDTAEAGFAEVSVKYAPGDICNNDLEDVNFTAIPGGVDVQGNSLGETDSNEDIDNDADVAIYSPSANSTPEPAEAENAGNDAPAATTQDEKRGIANNNGIINSTIAKSTGALTVGISLTVLVVLLIAVLLKRRKQK